LELTYTKFFLADNSQDKASALQLIWLDT